VLERAAEGTYRLVFARQDRALRAFFARRLGRLLESEPDAETHRRAILLYHDSTTMAILANLGLSTQLAVLGLCLALGVPALYPWLALASLALLPLLQLRREWLVRRALSGRRAA
jgi:archaetidylinositol phosphate synthase